jgi:hypothetical protein
MKTYTHPIAEISNDEVEANKAFPLIRELNYRYGLVVIGGASKRLADEVFDLNRRLYLVDEKGLYAGEVIYRDESYCFRSVVTYKERGQGESRFEYYSAKLPALMGTLKREKAVLTGDDLFNKLIRSKLIETVGHYDESFGVTHKKSELGGGHEHLLLQIVFNNRSLQSIPTESINYFQLALDTFSKIDMLVEERKNQIEEVFANPITAACLDKTGTYLVGKVRINPAWSANNDRSLHQENTMITVVEPFKRVKNLLEDVPDLRHRLVMTKTFIEQNSRWSDRYKINEESMFPVTIGNRDTYLPEVNVVTISADKWHSSSTDSSQPEWTIFL